MACLDVRHRQDSEGSQCDEREYDRGKCANTTLRLDGRIGDVGGRSPVAPWTLFSGDGLGVDVPPMMLPSGVGVAAAAAHISVLLAAWAVVLCSLDRHVQDVAAGGGREVMLACGAESIVVNVPKSASNDQSTLKLFSLGRSIVHAKVASSGLHSAVSVKFPQAKTVVATLKVNATPASAASSFFMS